MDQTNTKLSPIKEIYCINCHEELILDLAERRGEKDIVCPKCKSSFSINKAEEFMKNISPITEGKCPNCSEVLIFDIEDRKSKDKIKCPTCGDYFYLKDVLNPSNKVKEKDQILNKSKTVSHSKNKLNKSQKANVDSMESEDILLIIPRFISNMIEVTGIEYFSTPTIFSIDVSNGKEKILEIENVFEDVPIQAICFKLFHNKKIVSSYSMDYLCHLIGSGKMSFEDLQLNPTDNYYLKLEVSTGGINTLDKKGYGLLSFNHKGFVNTLFAFDSAIEDYIANLVKEDPKYKELLRISEFTTPNSHKELDFITVEFLQRNRDFFADYLK